MDVVTRVPFEKAFTLTYQADDSVVSFADGEPSTLSMAALQSQLETWADSTTRPTPVLMRSLIPAYDNVYVFVDVPNVQLREIELVDGTREVKAIGTITLYRVE